MPRKYSTEERVAIFWSRVDKNGPFPSDPGPTYSTDLGPCWLWTARLGANGYAVFSLKGHRVLVHRLAYELSVGPIDQPQLDHLCRVRHCVKPSHLESVTNQINGLRGTSPPAHNARKTHCQNGHAFDETNTRHHKHGRHCRACRRVPAEVNHRRFAGRR